MIFRVCTVDDVPLGEGRSVRIDERQIALFRGESGWYALDNRCPHRDGPLADGIVADRSVICPLHERRFDLASGRELTGELCVAAHQVLLHGRDVFIVVKEQRMEQSIYQEIGGAAATR